MHFSIVIKAAYVFKFIENVVLKLGFLNRRLNEELPAAYGGHQNHWRYLDGKVVERLDYISDVLELPSLNCKPNLKRIIDLLTTTVQPEVLGPISRHKLFQMKRKSIQCGKTQNKLEQQRNKTPKQKHYFNRHGKVSSNMNVS
ncbi:hypothetical protein Smp_127470 [Schistosoma mansoni]|uniref:hypothetical protein n=1 Tax=Schistosoma mansoni TaxID=6183 RepID=UPI0001A636CB|nr:hypothetical protein Smp_127470 [Schistosoma mansoni]|eukprot:XP_018651072.1 hypothetical protein Smp_127470 [Schistosoma mansoni]